MSEQEQEKSPVEEENRQFQSEYAYTIAVRFGTRQKAYSFGTNDPSYKAGDQVVVETSRGMELGTCAQDEKAMDFFHAHVPLKPVLRHATEQDLRMYEENQEYSKEAFHVCENEIENLNLPMHLLSAEYMLDRSRILFVYQAEQRVDFRDLLKRLGTRLHCRIELRQIKDRDKARLVGGIGMCGMECCCARFMTDADHISISINMAKTQLLALNTEKLSGMCGKLMCCLKFENENYKELTQGLPKIGAHVEYHGVMYRVTSMNVMTNEAHLENSESFQVVTLDDLRENAVVRKGITVGRKTGRTVRQANSAPGVHKPTVSSGPLASHFATSEESRRHEPAPELKEMPVREKAKNTSGTRSNTSRRRTGAHAGLVPQKTEGAGERRNSGGSRSRSRNRRGGSRRTAENTNPNVTVRSFKSSKTLAREAGSEEK